MKSEEAEVVKQPKEKVKPVAPADKYIWAIYIMLCIISIIEQYSASARVVSSTNIFGPLIRHCGHLLLGFGVIYVVQKIPYTKFIKWIPALAIGSVFFAIYVMLWGDVINGARRSVKVLGLMSLQPAEFIKFSAAALLALILSKSQLKDGKGVSNRGFWTAIIVTGILAAVLIKQGTTNTLILCAISYSMMIFGGVQAKRLLIMFAAAAVLIVGVISYGLVEYNKKYDENGKLRPEVALSASEQIAKGETVDRLVDVFIPRLIRWWNGDEKKWEQEINRYNHQEQYSYIAQANGGLFGVFPGNSREAARLPLAFSDYIFAIVIEDIGLLGGVFLLALYLFLMARASGIASQCKRAFPMLLVMGMALYITFQALFHMGIVSGLFPVSGQPLPLISAGGSSILVTSMALGVMLSVSRFAIRKKNNDKKEDKEEISALPEDARADNPSLL